MATLVVILVVIFSMAIHEAGHIIAAIFFKHEIKAIHVGYPARPLIKIEVKGIPVTFSPWLVAMGVNVEANDIYEKPWWQSTLLFLYGPLANIAIATLAAWLFLGFNQGASVANELFFAGSAANIQLMTLKVPVCELVGPFGIVTLFTQILAIDFWKGVLFAFLVLNFSLGFFNLLPIPPLDSGRIILLTLVKWSKKPNKARTQVEVFASWALLVILVLILVLTLQDTGFVGWCTGG